MFLIQDDKKLIEKALSGNQSAWCKLVKRHEKAVYGYLLRMTGNQSDAMDLMQDTFIAVSRNLADFRQESSFKTWALSLAYYKCMDFYRRNKLDVSDDEDLDSFESNNNHLCPIENLQKIQTSQELMKVVNDLPFNQKNVIELKIFQQLTFDQIAEQTGVSTNTVKSRFYGAIEKLKETIRSSEYAA